MIVRIRGNEAILEHSTGPTLRAVWSQPGAGDFAVGDSGVVLRANGGMWETIPVPTTANLTAVHATGSAIVIAGTDGTVLIGTPVATTCAVSFAHDIQPIFDTYCIGCHNVIGPALVQENSWSALQSSSLWECGQFVVPEHPDQSYLLAKLSGSTVVANPACARSMPADWMGSGDVPLAKLDPIAFQKIRLWIEQGALNN